MTRKACFNDDHMFSKPKIKKEKRGTTVTTIYENSNLIYKAFQEPENNNKYHPSRRDYFMVHALGVVISSGNSFEYDVIIKMVDDFLKKLDEGGRMKYVNNPKPLDNYSYGV